MRFNVYTGALGKFFLDTPKAVFAAIAYSFADRLIAKSASTDIMDCLVQEWKTLYENGIVTQKPPGWKATFRKKGGAS